MKSNKKTLSHEEQVEVAHSLNESLDANQKFKLIQIADMCESLGATKEQLAPIFATIFLPRDIPIPEESKGIEEFIAQHGVTQRCVETELGEALLKASKKNG